MAFKLGPGRASVAVINPVLKDDANPSLKVIPTEPLGVLHWAKGKLVTPPAMKPV